MRIGRVQLGPGAVILVVLLMVGLVYAGLRQLGVLDTLLAKIDPRTSEKGSVVPDKRERLEDISVTSLPPSAVKAPERTGDNPEVTIGVWTWQTVSGIIDAVGGPGKSVDYQNSCRSEEHTSELQSRE